MLHRAGTAVSIPVLFSSGIPDGGVDWRVFGPDGFVIASGIIAVPVGSVSTAIQISGAMNTLPAGSLVSYRDVAWSYSVAGIVMGGDLRYSIEARIPFGASADGVRSKLGVDNTDLPNGEISLVSAYYSFSENVGAARLEAARIAPTDVQRLIIANAIEATAGLAHVPTMSVRIASKESSGTNQFQRQKIDWNEVALALEGAVGAGRALLIPGFDPTAEFGALLILATPALDPFTGAESSR